MTVTEREPLLPTTSQPSAPPQETTSELYGYQLMALAAIASSAMSFFVHEAESVYNFPTNNSLFIRALVQTILSLLSIVLLPSAKAAVTTLTARKIALLFFRGLTGALALAAIFIAFRLLPVGDAVTILYFSPVIALFLSQAVLGEPITRVDAAAAAISISGTLLIARPGSHGPVAPADRITGSLCALFCAGFVAVAFVTVRHLGTSIHFMESVFALGFVSLLLAVLLGGAMGPSALLQMKGGARLVFISSICGFVAQCFMNKALQHCRAGPGEVVRTMEVPIAYLLGMIFLGEKVSIFSLAGSGMVLVAAVIIGMRQLIAS